MKAFVSSVPNWHRYAIAFLTAVSLLAAAMVSGAVAVPEGVRGYMPYVALLSFFLAAFLPRVQAQTGPGAPPLLSPPAHDDPPLSDGLPPRG